MKWGRGGGREGRDWCVVISVCETSRSCRSVRCLAVAVQRARGALTQTSQKGGFPLVGGEGVSQNKARLNRITLMLCVRTRCTLFPIRAGQIRVRAAHLSEGEVS